MIIVRPQDIQHKIELLRLLVEISDNNYLAQNLYFKGGTCASMLGYLDRFSVGLDFDRAEPADIRHLQDELTRASRASGLEIKDQKEDILEFVMKYKAKIGQRFTLKLSAIGPILKGNHYEPRYLPEIDRVLTCQSIETMFANKLVALLDRYQKDGTIAGRDLYDIHHFFLQGYRYLPSIIEERTSLSAKIYLDKLKKFIQEKITERIVNEDLNTLLTPDKFERIRKNLKTETLGFLENELANLKGV